MGALIATTGLVIDGGQKAQPPAGPSRPPLGPAVQPAMTATQQLGGADPSSAAVLAAKAYLAGQPGIKGTVAIATGFVTITTSAECQRSFSQ